MLNLKKTKEDLKIELDFFIWDFKVGDNIKYNLNVLYNLIDDYNNSGKDYKKPISIIAVSVIEAIMIDFLYRLYKGTYHFPDNLRHLESEIKEKLNNETIRSELVILDGQKYYVSALKNFNFTPMVRVYKKLTLLGNNKEIYENLLSLAHLRNRIHITNYFNNFEKDEHDTFSESRVQEIFDTMIWFFDYFKDNYERPWTKN